MTQTHNFLTQVRLGYKALYYHSDPMAYVTAALASPALFVLTFAILGRFVGRPEAAERYMIGMIALSASLTVLQGVLQTFSSERGSGTLHVRFGARGSRWASYLSRGCLPFGNAMLSIVVSLVFAWIFLGLNIERVHWLTLSAALVAISFSCTAMALFVGNFVLIVRSYLEFAGLFHGGLLLLTGALIPTALLPGPLAAAAHLLPVTSGLLAFRGGFGGSEPALVAGALTQEVFVGVAYLVLGFITQQLFAQVARRQGTIDVWVS